MFCQFYQASDSFCPKAYKYLHADSHGFLSKILAEKYSKICTKDFCSIFYILWL